MALELNAANAMPEPYAITIPEYNPEDTELEFPPPVESPHVMTLPSLFRAANELPVEYTATTPEDKLEDTELELPPHVEYPHVTTLPLLFRAAKE